MIRGFSDLIADIQTRHLVRRRFKCPSAGFKRLIELAKLHGLPRLTLQAQQRMLDGVSEIFTWAQRETLMATNPAAGLGSELSKRSGVAKVKQHEQREALSADDLRRIFSATWFVNGSGDKTGNGRFYAYRPHYFWLPLLGLFVGGRLNECHNLTWTTSR